VTIELGGAAGYAFRPMTAAEVRRTAIPGTITFAIEIGRAVRVERRLLGGFARGVLQLVGTGADRGRSLRIDFQNEGLIARSGTEEIFAVVPDLICLVDEDSAKPVTTEIVRYGVGVVVLGIPGPEMLKTPKALEVIGPA
jgi:uncharacterized protein